ncbi:hypothetical protein Purlil1_4605 [Purpureocillium lilacinum]|uniref:Uncharacterized protein n=1 Tax=Purpureocillium lilacinum TaxID=33203 RepID=A0ABR0C475_PURLI|nr:hypothetical protein Purlil1_4605 [Purpureocillium lilacinum]
MQPAQPELYGGVPGVVTGGCRGKRWAPQRAGGHLGSLDYITGTRELHPPIAGTEAAVAARAGAEQQRHFSGASRLIRAGEARCVAVEPAPQAAGSAGLDWAGLLPRQLMEPALTA